LAAGAGFFCAMMSMLVAAAVEYFRLQYAPPGALHRVSFSTNTTYLIIFYFLRFQDGDFFDLSAQDNITPCQNLDDYNPCLYQKVSYLLNCNDGIQHYCNGVNV
jgi:hypothetical protein